MSVEAYLQHFEAVSEFDGFTDTCGETAALVLEHCKDGTPLADAAGVHPVAAVREDMARLGYGVNGGTTMSELVDYFSKHRGLDVVEANGYGSSWDAIHQTCLDNAGRNGVAIEVELAYELTGNEGGVRRHFVALGAIHPTLGYLVANGDDVLALNAHGGHGKVIPCRWMDRNVLERARPSACAVVRGLPWATGMPASLLAKPVALSINEAGLIEDDPASLAGAGGSQETGDAGGTYTYVSNAPTNIP